MVAKKDNWTKYGNKEGVLNMDKPVRVFGIYGGKGYKSEI